MTPSLVTGPGPAATAIPPPMSSSTMLAPNPRTTHRREPRIPASPSSRRARIVRKGPEREPPPFGRFADGDTGLVPGAAYSGPGRVVVVVDDAVVGGGAVVGGVVDGVVDAGGCGVEDEPGLLVLGVVSPG